MKYRYFLPLLIFCLIPCISNSQTSSRAAAKSRLIHETDSILNSQVNTGRIPGAVVLIRKNDKLIYRHAYGFASKYDFNLKILPDPEKMTTAHLFDIASLTKVVGTTTSIMLLADRGKLNVDDPVSKYLRAFDTPEKKNITIRQLLTHTAGLYEWYPLYYFASGRQETYKLIESLPLRFIPGEQRRYSDLGFTLLGEIVELVSGMPLEVFEEQNIFKPLGMRHTLYNPLANGKFNKIAATSPGNPYEKRMVSDSTLGFRLKEVDPSKWNGWRQYVLKGEVNDGNAWYAGKGVCGAAGLFSTADDIQKLVDMLMKGGRAGGKQFISSSTIKSFLSKDKFNNGLGWMMDPENSFMKGAPDGSFGHTGFTGTSIAVVPEEKISVILLINRQNTGLNAAGDYYNVNPVRLAVFKAVMKNLVPEN
jgi:serine-type D-Ala-D-Ala carboxypeptidase